MKFSKKIIGLLTGSSLFVSTVSIAASLDLTTWETLGDVQIVNSNLVNLSNNSLFKDDFGIGLDEDYNFSGNRAIDNFFFDLETELGLLPGALDLDSNKFEYAYEGSALKKVVKVKAGEQLRFDWNFLSNETFFWDYGFLLVDNTVIELSDFNQVSVSSRNYTWETGRQTYNYTFSNSGERTIAFGVVDIGDYDVSSALEISNISLLTVNQDTTKTPESNAVIGLFCLGTIAIICKQNPF